MTAPARTVVADGHPVAVREWGDYGAPAIVFWHALGPAASGALAVEVGERLAELGWRFLAIDGPGFAGSEPLAPGDYSIARLARLHLGVVDSLAGGHAILMGHSWGGVIALHAAASAPERTRALVLVDSGHIDYADLMPEQAARPRDAWIADARAQIRAWPTVEAFVADAREGAPRWSAEIERALVAGITVDESGVRPATNAETAGAALHGTATTRASDAWPAVAAAGLHVLLLLATKPPHGDQNRAHVGRFTDALPNAEVRWVPDASHSLITDVGPPLGDEIAGWLANKIEP